MAERTLHIVDPAPEHEQRAALKPDVNPALQGTGDLQLLCGQCRAVLAHKIWPNLVYDVGMICAECGTFNDTPSAVGGTVYGAVVYLPVGTYRLGAPVQVRNDVPIIGELFPGAGPPATDNLVTLDGGSG